MIAARSLALTGLYFAAFSVALGAIACGSDAVSSTVATGADSSTTTPLPTPSSTSDVQTPTSVPATPTPAPTSTPAGVIPDLVFVNNADCDGLSHGQLPLADVEISDGTHSVILLAEMAISSAEQSQGLMCRETVPGGTGMLFIWDEERTGGFWMFNTYAPLDIIYFGASDGGVALKQMAPCPRRDGESNSAWNSRCGEESTPYRPGIMYTTTLELPQGWLESFGFDTNNLIGLEVSFTART